MENETGEDLIRVAFPPTDQNQYWSAFRIVTKQRTIMVHPSSNLELHVETLRDFYNQNTKIEDVLNTPINAPGEVEIFGIYLSPSIRTHVFRGTIYSRPTSKQAETSGNKKSPSKPTGRNADG